MGAGSTRNTDGSPAPPISSGFLAPPPSASGGFLAPPSAPGAPNTGANQGSIALRAMRSVRSLARMGSWAQFGAMEEDGKGSKEKEGGAKEKKDKKKNDGTVGKKEGKDKEKKEKKSKTKKTEDAEGGADDGKKSKKSSKSSKSKSSKLKDSANGQGQTKEASTLRLSTSSFEVGALSASPARPCTLGESTSSSASAGAAHLGVQGVAQKKRSILGLGLPSTIRLRSGSTASSVLVGGANTVGPSFNAAAAAAAAAATPSVPTNTNNRLSVDSALNNIPAATPRPSSALSNASSAGSSLRPISTTSTDSRLSRRSSAASSVRWDEEGLETIRERRGRERAAADAGDATAKDKAKEKADKRASKESKRSVEGRKRGSLASLFPETARRTSYASSEGGWGSGADEKGGVGHVGYPIVTIEEATVDGHGCVDDEEVEDRMLVDESEHQEEDRMNVDGDEAPATTMTPVKQQKTRTRPVSEQMLKGSRPKAVYEDDEGSFFFSFISFSSSFLAYIANTTTQ